jgi:glycosyltransferase involved in cell wall biosynthesis
VAEIQRVALLSTEHPQLGHAGGIGTYTATLADALASAGIDVRCFVADEQGRVSMINRGTATLIGIWSGPVILRPLATKQLLSRHIGAFAPDIVEAPNWGGLGACIRVPHRSRLIVRLSTPVLGIRPRDLLRAALAGGHHTWECRSAQRAARVIADSTAVATLAERLYRRGIDAIIPHPLAASATPAPSPDGTGVLAVGRLEHRKGTDVLLTAWATVRKQRPGWTLHLVGADVGGFGTAACARHGAEGVVMHGRLDAPTLARVASTCPIATIPSRWESFGMVVLEAWDRGQAVVASDAGGLPEVVGDAGLIARSGNAEDLAAGLLRLMDDPGLRLGLARRGRERLRDRFDPTSCAVATLQVYRDAALDHGT